LKELASEEDVIGLCRTNEKSISCKLSQRDIMLLSRLPSCLHLFIRDCRMPTQLASGKEKHISQGGVERMCVPNANERASMKMKDNILRGRQLFTLLRQNKGNLSDRSIRSLIVPPITAGIKAKGK
jgi:hypothetical protein